MSKNRNRSKLTRRTFFKQLGAGIAAAALVSTLPATARAAE